MSWTYLPGYCMMAFSVCYLCFQVLYYGNIHVSYRKVLHSIDSWIYDIDGIHYCRMECESVQFLLLSFLLSCFSYWLIAKGSFHLNPKGYEFSLTLWTRRFWHPPKAKALRDSWDLINSFWITHCFWILSIYNFYVLLSCYSCLSYIWVGFLRDEE